ncbi:MAG: hypothetical protein LBQ35_09615 [Spirochaetaceae bacterium]|jgi:hypothetical protein|nr:hypothetical protein [Spirochaetaceae bacterium]
MNKQLRVPGAVLVTGIFVLGALLSSCINPMGFPLEVHTTISGDVDVTIKPGEDDRPGTVSGPDDPNTHPGAGVGALVFKNLTGGDKAIPVEFHVTGVDNRGDDVDAALSLSAGGERSLVLNPSWPDPYTITLHWVESGEGRERSLSKALLSGRVEYVYFYVNKDGAYAASGESGDVYVNVDLNYYQDNENSGENGDGDSVSGPEEGDVSRDGAPRHKLPATLRNNYGIVWVHNMSRTKPLLKVVFDHSSDGGITWDAHWEMNPGPDKGLIKSVILRSGAWKVRALWIDPNDPSCAGGVLENYIVISAGDANYINHLYFYRGAAPDGKWHLTGEADTAAWTPPLDADDFNAGGAAETGAGSGADLGGEGEYTNENEGINSGSAWWDAEGRRGSLGILTVKNLSYAARVDSLSFEFVADPSVSFVMEALDPRGERSIILRKGPWKISARISAGQQSYERIAYKTIAPLGLTNRVNYVYIWYDGTAYQLGTDQTPPAGHQNDDPNGGSGGGEEVKGEGETTNENAAVDTGNNWWNANREEYGILVIRNLSSNIAISTVEVTGTNPNRQYGMAAVAISARSDRSMILKAGVWQVRVNYNHGGAGKQLTAVKTIVPYGLAGRLNYLYFYWNGGPDYVLSAGDTYPGDYASDAGGTTVTGDAEGSSPGALTDANRGVLGLLILKNLAPDAGIDSAVFTRQFAGSPPAYSMTPGPASRDQKSILLGGGDWAVTAAYTRNGAGSAGPKTATIAAGQISYMYFYKTRTGAYSLATSWSPVPGDAAGENTDPTQIGENEGWLHVVNSSARAVINKVQYNNGSAWIDLDIPNATHTIEPQGVSDPDLVVTSGNYAFRFKIITKDTYSRAVSRTIRPGQITTVEYTDAMDTDEPPDGYGTLRIINDSSSTINKVAYLNMSLVSAWQEAATIITPGTNASLILPAPNSGGYTYVVRAYISSSSTSGNVYVERQVNIENQKISTITVTNNSDTGTETGTGTAQIRIYNNYDDYERRSAAGTLRPVLPARIFKIVLKSGSAAVVRGTANNTEGGTLDGSLGLRAGEYALVSQSIAAGNYTLTVTWGNTIFSDAVNTTTVGTYYLANGTFRDIYVDLYNSNVEEATAVSVIFAHVGYPSAASIAQINLVYAGGAAPGNSNSAQPIPRHTDGTVNNKYIVYKNTGIFYAGDSITFKVPGNRLYYARVYWPLWDDWYGQGPNSNWTQMDMTAGVTSGVLNFVFDRTGSELGWFPN